MDAPIDARTGLQDLEPDECLRLLAGAAIGRVAVMVGDRPLIFPVNFTLDGRSVVFRTNEGTKLYGARSGPVAFECDGIDREYHTGWSVLVQADAEEVLDAADVAHLERLPLAPWCDAPKPVWVRLRPQSMTGRCIPTHGSTLTEEEWQCR